MPDDMPRDPERRRAPGDWNDDVDDRQSDPQDGRWRPERPRALVDGVDGDGLEVGEDGPVLARPRSRRARAWRLGLTLALVALALVVVVGGPLGLLQLALRPARGVTAPAPGITGPHLDATGWTPAPVPRGTQDVRTIDVRPSPANANVGYACWLAGGLGPAPVALRFSISADGERSWRAAAAPAAMASACEVIPDAADERHVVALIDANANTGACASFTAYASADGAQSWSPVPWPGPLRGACDRYQTLYSLDGRLYAWSPLYQLSTPRAPGALLYRSDDDGRSWQVIDPAPGDDTVAIVAGHADGSVLAFARPLAGAPSAPRVWASPDGGTTWTALGTAPAATTLVYATGDPAPPKGGWGTLYAVALPPGTIPTAELPPVAIAVGTANGWRPLGPFPLPGAGAELPLGPDGAILGVGPGGVLLTAVVDTSDNRGINNGLLAPPHMIWGWDPIGHMWLPDYHIVPSNTEVEGFSWVHPPSGPERIVILVFTINAGSPPFTGLFRATLVAPATSTSAGGLGSSR